MGGEIGVESRLGRGSTFSFRLRLARGTAASADPSAGRARLEGVRVLLVDDVAADRSILQGQLEALGLAVTRAEDAFAAYAALDRSWHRGLPYAILVIDEIAPAAASETLVRRLRSEERFGGVRLVGVSPKPTIHAAGMPKLDGVLLKPVAGDELARTLARLVEASRAGAAA
jgi:CheY-like chemotaxis protein